MNAHPGIAKVSRVLVVVLAVVVDFVGARLFGAHRWQEDTQDLRARLDAAREPVRPKKVDFGELESLPAPVGRYFRAVLQDGQPMVTGVSVRHTGTFNMGEGAEANWKRFASDQVVVTQRPGFDRDGRVAMVPGAPIRVHDHTWRARASCTPPCSGFLRWPTCAIRAT
jgi:hypothetical protein